jgi:hypothetical protein
MPPGISVRGAIDAKDRGKFDRIEASTLWEVHTLRLVGAAVSVFEG